MPAYPAHSGQRDSGIARPVFGRAIQCPFRCCARRLLADTQSCGKAGIPVLSRESEQSIRCSIPNAALIPGESPRSGSTPKITHAAWAPCAKCVYKQAEERSLIVVEQRVAAIIVLGR